MALRVYERDAVDVMRVASGRRARRLGSRRARAKVATLRERDGDACWICGATINFALPTLDRMARTLDHVIPRSQGGANHNANLRLAHRACNEQRGRALEQAA